jgi:hypothetical protein
MTTVGYDPDRVALLLERVGNAAAALSSIRCDDPAAAQAAAAVRRARSNLEQRWLPALRRITGLTALTSWTLRLDLDTELALRALVALVDGPTRPELRALGDERLLRDLERALAATIDGGESTDPAVWVRYVALLAELARRVSSPHGTSVLAALDPETARALVRAAALGSELSRGGHVLGVQGDAFDGVALPALTIVLSGIATSGSDATASLASLATDPATAPTVSAAMLRSLAAFPTSALTTIVGAELTASDQWPMQPERAAQRLAALVELLEELETRPGGLSALLASHADATRVLTTTRLLDETLVTRLVATALGRPDPSGAADRAGAFAQVVALTADTTLTDAAHLAIAAASPAWLPLLQDRDVNPSPARDFLVDAGGARVRLGTNADVSRFLGTVVERDDVSTLLHTGMLAVVESKVDDAVAGLATVGAGPARDALLADVSRIANVMGVLADAKHEREEQLDRERAAAGDLVGVGFDLFDVVASGLPVVGQVATGLVERVVHRAVTGPAHLPELEVLTTTTEEVVVALLAAPLADPSLRDPLQLDVDDAVWDRVSDAIEAYRSAAPEDVDEAWTDVELAYADHPALDGYVSAILHRLDLDAR